MSLPSAYEFLQKQAVIWTKNEARDYVLKKIQVASIEGNSEVSIYNCEYLDEVVDELESLGWKSHKKLSYTLLFPDNNITV